MDLGQTLLASNCVVLVDNVRPEANDARVGFDFGAKLAVQVGSTGFEPARSVAHKLCRFNP